MKLIHFLLFIFLPNLMLEGQSIREEIQNIIIHDTEISYSLTPGFVIGIIDGNNTFVESFGKVADDKSKELTEDDIFEIGSITKLLTAAMVDIAVSDNRLTLQDPLNNFLPDSIRNPRCENITIYDLLHHQTSFSRRPSFFGDKELDWQNPYAYYSKSDLLEYYTNFVPDSGKYGYSHINYALLEHILEQVYSMSFNDLVNENIFAPLGMSSSFVNFKEDRNITTPGKDRSGTLVTPWTFASFAGSEGIKSSVSDMIVFLRAYASIGSSPLSKIWSDNLDQNEPSFEEDISVSYGWQKVKINKRITAAIHTGTTSGHACFIGLIKETGTAVVVMANSSFGTRDLGMLVLRMINHNWKRKPNQ